MVGSLALVARFADRVDTAPDGTVTARRGELACVARPVPGTDPALVAVAPMARCLGGHVAWDGATKTLMVAFDGPVDVRTLPPYDPSAPRVAPATVFTPEPAPPTPRVVATGSPHPRRTPIPVTAPTAPRP